MASLSFARLPALDDQAVHLLRAPRYDIVSGHGDRHLSSQFYIRPTLKLYFLTEGDVGPLDRPATQIRNRHVVDAIAQINVNVRRDFPPGMLEPDLPLHHDPPCPLTLPPPLHLKPPPPPRQ